MLSCLLDVLYNRIGKAYNRCGLSTSLDARVVLVPLLPHNVVEIINIDADVVAMLIHQIEHTVAGRCMTLLRIFRLSTMDSFYFILLFSNQYVYHNEPSRLRCTVYAGCISPSEIAVQVEVTEMSHKQ